jgi:Fe-S-cluster containining protein
MTELGGVALVSSAEFDAFMAAVRRRLGAIKKTSSRYYDLTRIARVHQEFGNALSAMIYTAEVAGRPKLACAAGCSTCCLIPSEKRPQGAGYNFAMSYLDVITLVEAYPEIKAADQSLPERAISAVEEAERTNGLVACPHLRRDGGCGIYPHRPVACKIWFSADLDLCVRNRSRGYPRGINAWTDASKDIYDEFQKPFEALVSEIAPDLTYDGLDFLTCLGEIATIDRSGLIATWKEKIEAGETASWDPFNRSEA